MKFINKQLGMLTAWYIIKKREFMNTKYKKLFFEFFRYCIVGGIAFLADFGLLHFFYSVIIGQDRQYSLFISTALGFVGGLIVNYILSLVFVFLKAKEEKKGRDIKSFAIFVIIGIIGLFFTELGMYFGVKVLLINYMVVKIFVTGLVLVWNYLMRKILIFK